VLLWTFENFRPIGCNANRKFKGVPNFLGVEIQNSDLAIYAASGRLRACKVWGWSVNRAATENEFLKIGVVVNGLSREGWQKVG